MAPANQLVDIQFYIPRVDVNINKTQDIGDQPIKIILLIEVAVAAFEAAHKMHNMRWVWNGDVGVCIQY
jgi:hypothetical protein